ncbi:50S ribosomal protein L25/general stress protein Ctc [Acaricomes phytoseiuli]|uniref:50S ribosomal protein L25/general stress protein Ctc n=1 Tax=Acaricomes phytoseiuli TaxID=291968 RepID=UPI0003712BAE|nr:50S ribosomal protein L25/general stress protein Ctc [Acaricomes phytoseiuli]MCW1249275.1 50S ribosomal protein L25/general stress protein Ctc [Acaricomes phytoseiuli]
MVDNKLAAQLRTEFGKGAARRARRDNLIPAVIYGHGEDPVHIVLPELATARVARNANALVAIDLDGKEHLTLIKDIQRDPVLQIIEHIDLLTVRRGEKVTVDVPVTVEGEPAPGAVANQEATTVSIEAEATDLPDNLLVSVEGREAGAHVLASDLLLPKGVALLVDADTLIVNVAEPEEQDLGEEGEEEPAATEESAESEAEGEAAE